VPLRVGEYQLSRSRQHGNAAVVRAGPRDPLDDDRHRHEAEESEERPRELAPRGVRVQVDSRGRVDDPLDGIELENGEPPKRDRRRHHDDDRGPVRAGEEGEETQDRARQRFGDLGVEGPRGHGTGKGVG
jgi:hypothetical protein